MKTRNRTKRPGSGRTAGSYSFTTLTLSQLTSKFSDPNMPIQVGRKWAETIGFTGLVIAPANKITTIPVPAALPLADTAPTVADSTTTPAVQA